MAGITYIVIRTNQEIATKQAKPEGIRHVESPVIEKETIPTVVVEPETYVPDTPTETTYEPAIANNFLKLSVVFEGEPDEKVLRPMMEYVMNRHNMAITAESVMRVGDALFVLRKASLVGVTEMDILKFVYQKGSTKLTLDQNFALAATLLETSK